MQRETRTLEILEALFEIRQNHAGVDRPRQVQVSGPVLSFAVGLVVPPGFRAESVWTFAVSLPGESYRCPDGTDRALRGLEAALEARGEIG